MKFGLIVQNDELPKILDYFYFNLINLLKQIKFGVIVQINELHKILDFL